MQSNFGQKFFAVFKEKFISRFGFGKAQFGRAPKPNGARLKNNFQASPKEIARILLDKRSALRVRQIDDEERYCEIYTHGSWKRLDKDWAQELFLIYGYKARRFVQKHIPELLGTE